MSYSTEPLLESLYDPNYLNCGHNLQTLIDGLVESGGARLCISGPTGSGKTAFASYLAGRLDRPLLEVRPSDLLAKTIGETAQRIAELFATACERGALLLIDEIDSFLHARSADGPQWGSVATNEMLLQIEDFGGYLVATTNRLNALDTAGLRRFEVKLQSDYLTATQVAELVARLARLLAIPVADEAAIGTMTAAIGFATVGDFALLQRRHRCMPFHSIEALVAALREEVALKQNVPRTMGFC